MKEKYNKIQNLLLETEKLLADRYNGAWRSKQTRAEKKLIKLLRRLESTRMQLADAYFENF